MKPLILVLCLACVAGAACSTAPVASIRSENLPETFEPVARLEDSFLSSEFHCRSHFNFTQDCTSFPFYTSLKRKVRLDEIQIRAAATSDGRVIAFYPDAAPKLFSGVSVSDLSNVAYRAVKRVLDANGVEIIRVRALRLDQFIQGYVLELGSDGYSILQQAPPVPEEEEAAKRRAQPDAEDGRRGKKRWASGDGALLVNAPPLVIEEARGFDALFRVTCDNVYAFVQDCSNILGPKREIWIHGVEARIASTRGGDTIMVSTPPDLVGDLGRVFDPRITDPVNLTTRAVLVVLETRGLEVRRVRAVVMGRRGPVIAYLIDTEGDGYSVLKQLPEPPPRKPPVP